MISSAYKPASLGDLFKIGPALFSIHKSISHHALCAYGELEERRPPVLFGFEDIVKGLLWKINFSYPLHLPLRLLLVF